MQVQPYQNTSAQASLSRNASVGGILKNRQASVSSRIKELDEDIEVNLKAMIEDG
jgi:hypothetical protein